MQAAVIDPHFSAKGIERYPLVVYPGSPVTSRLVEGCLENYVRGGGTLLITGTLPAQYDTGDNCTFLGGVTAGTQTLGNGRVIFCDRYLADTDAEADNLDDIEDFGAYCDEAGVVPAVRIGSDTVASWVDWGREGGGHKEYLQPRMLGSAILQTDGDEKILFVLNSYPEAHRFTLKFASPCTKLVCLTEEEDVDVVNGCAEVEIDRKNCQIFRVV